MAAKLTGILIVLIAGTLVRAQCEPQTIGSVATMGNASEVAVSGSMAYVLSRSGAADGLDIIDVNDPTNPVVVGSLSHSGDGLAVSGSHAYVSGGSFTVVDVSDPTDPSVVGSLAIGGSDVAISGSLAYVAAAGLAVVDISDPSSPLLIGSVDTPGSPEWVTVSGTTVYLGERGAPSQSLVIDVSDPEDPTIIGSIGVAPGPTAVAGNLLYLLQPGNFLVDSNLVVYDVSDPSDPTLLSNLQIPAQGFDLAIQGGRAYTAQSRGTGVPINGLRVIDISDPTAPSLLGFGQTTNPVGVAVAGTLAYLANGVAGFEVMDISSCWCYADCDGSGSLDFFDFLCFQNAFAAGDPQADCDGSGSLDFFDFLCFQDAFAAGCP